MTDLLTLKFHKEDQVSPHKTWDAAWMESALYLVVIPLDCKSFSHIPAIKSEILDEGCADNESGVENELSSARSCNSKSINLTVS